MQPKFILTLSGHLRIGYVAMHKDLLLPDDTCIGGGYWAVDYVRNCLLLSGRSYDYGKPKWSFIDGKLFVPRGYRGMAIVYSGDSPMDDVDVSAEFETIYY